VNLIFFSFLMKSLSDPKVPSVLLYDTNGNVMAWGAQTTNLVCLFLLLGSLSSILPNELSTKGHQRQGGTI
jgi:hypothetical protein